MREDAAHRLIIRDKETRERVEREVMDRIKAAVKAAADRDSWLRELSDQVDGMISTGILPWKDACDLDYPLTIKALLTVHANNVQAMRREPMTMVEAAEPEDEPSAQMQEPFLTAKYHQANGMSVLQEIDWNRLMYPVSIAYVGWKDTFRTERFSAYLPEGLENPADAVPESMREAGVSYSEIGLIRQVPDHSGLDLRCVDTPDFYLYPANARNLQDCWGCGERVWMNAAELLAGIEDYEFDKAAVKRLLKEFPAGSSSIGENETRERGAEYAGVQGPDNGTDGDYECFFWFGKLPYLRDDDGEPILDEEYLKEECMFFCVPYAGIMLRMSYSPHEHRRPYIPFYLLKRKDSFYGYALPQILNALQTEANVQLRHAVNTMDIEMSPPIKMKSATWQKYKNYQFGPGRIWRFEQDPNEVGFMETPAKSQEGFALMQFFQSQAEEIYAAQNYGRQPAKVQKAAQVQQTGLAASARLDLLYYGFQLGLAELAPAVIALYAEFMEEDGEDFLDDLGNKRHISPNELKGRFIYRPLGSSQSADPQYRIENAMAQKKVADEYNAASASPQIPPDIKKRLWASARKVLIELGCHNPKELIGDEPQMEQLMQQPMMQHPLSIPALQQGGQPNPMQRQLQPAGGQMQ